MYTRIKTLGTTQYTSKRHVRLNAAINQNNTETVNFFSDSEGVGALAQQYTQVRHRSRTFMVDLETPRTLWVKGNCTPGTRAPAYIQPRALLFWSLWSPETGRPENARLGRWSWRRGPGHTQHLPTPPGH